MRSVYQPRRRQAKMIDINPKMRFPQNAFTSFNAALALLPHSRNGRNQYSDDHNGRRSASLSFQRSTRKCRQFPLFNARSSFANLSGPTERVRKCGRRRLKLHSPPRLRVGISGNARRRELLETFRANYSAFGRDGNHLSLATTSDESVFPSR